jgi:thymidylate kinase
VNYRIIALEGIDGGGKTTLLNGLEKSLSENLTVLTARPSRATVNAFKAVAETEFPGRLYHDVVPAGFRHTAYVLEGAVQFGYERARYEAADVVLFDRWRQTWDVYCEEIREHKDWLELVAATLPRPDVLLWLRVDPEVAYERLVARGDRWAEVYAPERMRAKIRGLCARYEEVMRDSGAVVLDGTGPVAEVLAEALRALAERGITGARAGGGAGQEAGRKAGQEVVGAASSAVRR